MFYVQSVLKGLLKRLELFTSCLHTCDLIKCKRKNGAGEKKQ